MQLKKRDRIVHLGFDVGLMIKAVNALTEIVGGIFFLLLPPEKINSIIGFLAKKELVEDPNDIVMNLLIRFSHSLGLETWHLLIFYLLSHGIVKAVVILLLWRKKLWAYPLSVVVFSFFIVYQVMKLTRAASTLFVLLTILDAIMIVLTIFEYKRIKRERACING